MYNCCPTTIMSFYFLHVHFPYLYYIDSFKLELNTEKEGFMAYTAREDAQRPRAVYAINPSFSVFNSNLFYFCPGFLVESFDFKQFKSKFVEIFPQV